MIKYSVNSKFIDLTFYILVIYTFCGFFLTNTVFAIPYATSFVSRCLVISFLLLSFIKINFRIENLKTNVYFIVWLPYFLYTILDFGIQCKFTSMGYWLICLLVLVFSKKFQINERIPYKYIMLWGSFVVLGIITQFLFPNFYKNFISILFSNRAEIIAFQNAGKGLTGFTYQLDVSAVAIMYAYGLLMYMPDYLKLKFSNKSLIIVKLLFFICIVMTGKRALIGISIIIPIFIAFMCVNSIKKLILYVFLAILGVLCMCNVFFDNIDKVKNIQFLNVFAKTYILYKASEDYSSGRSNLYKIALKLYNENMFFGVGVGKFIECSNAYTDVHNTYLQILCEQGIFGFISFLSPVLVCFFASIYKLRVLKQEGNCGMMKFSIYNQMFYLLYSLTGNTNVNLHCFVMYFLSIGIMICNYNFIPCNKTSIRGSFG